MMDWNLPVAGPPPRMIFAFTRITCLVTNSFPCEQRTVTAGFALLRPNAVQTASSVTSTIPYPSLEVAKLQSLESAGTELVDTVVSSTASKRDRFDRVP